MRAAIGVRCLVWAGLMWGICGRSTLAIAHAVNSTDSSTGDANAAAPYGTPVGDDTPYLHALLDEAEGRLGGDGSFRWDGEAWFGTDTQRLWFKSEGFDAQGRVEDGQQQLFYDRPISTYFDLQAGLRYDLDSTAGRGWAALGVEGLAPYNFQVSATGYISDGGHLAAKLAGAYEVRMTQRLIVEPDLELDAYSRPDPARHLGAGLVEIDAGVRARYEISRKLAPYLGLTYVRNHPPEQLDGWRAVFGVRAWL